MTHFEFWAPSDISRKAEASVVKFNTQIGYVIYKHTDDKPPLKWAWSGHMTYFETLCGKVSRMLVGTRLQKCFE